MHGWETKQVRGPDGQEHFGVLTPRNVPLAGMDPQSATTLTETHSITSHSILQSSAEGATCSTTADLNSSPSWHESISQKLYECGGIRPFYSDENTIIINADCREILPLIEPGSIDLVLTDPPYGIKRDGQQETFTKQAKHKRKLHVAYGWDDAPPSADVFAHMFRIGKDQVIWGANYFTPFLPPSMGWLVWDKGQELSMSDGELAYTSRQNALRIRTINRGAIAADGADHPTQKPERLFKWCIGLFPKAETILDPFMGSGTTLRAAKDLGRKAIGIEIEERYCEIAARRLQQSVMNLNIA